MTPLAPDDPAIVIVPTAHDLHLDRLDALGPFAALVEIVVLVDRDTSSSDTAAAVARLRSDASVDAAARLLPVTDAVKAVDDEDTVIATIDRSGLAYLVCPVALRRHVVEANPGGLPADMVIGVL